MNKIAVFACSVFTAISAVVASGEAPAGSAKSRIVPVDPLLTHVDSTKGELKFYWPGSADGDCGGLTLVARLDTGCERRASLGADGRAAIAFGEIAEGAHRLSLELRASDGALVATNGYRMVARRPLPEKALGRRLNNLVTELVNRPLADGTVEFVRAKSGWTWISFGDAAVDKADVRGYLDDGGKPVVLRRDGELYIETQRWLSEGPHRLRITGAKPGRTLKIHAVKDIWGSAPSNLSSDPVGLIDRFAYTLPFSQRFGLISTFNSFVRMGKYLEGGQEDVVNFYRERGHELVGSTNIKPTEPDRKSFDKLLRRLRAGSWERGQMVTVNENETAQSRIAADNFSDAVWTLFDEEPSHRINVFYGNAAPKDECYPPECLVSQYAAIANAGDGTGLILPELYAPVKETREQLQETLDRYARYLKAVETLAPCAKGSVLLYGAGFIDIFDFSNYLCPATDIKAHYSELIRAFATDPRFDGCSGIGFGGGFCCEEEFRRWGSKVTRHYALEGATNDLAAAYGFVWTPGFVKDPDFANGLADWNIRPAEEGSLRGETIKGYGRRCQRRTVLGYGDTVAVFKTSAKGANEVSQKLVGLQPGRVYALHFALADRTTMTLKKGKGVKALPRVFSAQLDGAEKLTPLCYEHIRCGQRNFRYVFRAKSSEATLRLTDTRDGKLNEPGVELLLNYVVFRPYYLESDEDIADLVKTLGWKGI